jgi:hypothetical protein
MSKRLVVALFAVFALAVQMHAADRVIYVLVDPAAHRAYIPEGTVLPEGLQIRTRALTSSGDTVLPEIDRSFRLNFAKALNAKRSETAAAPPLVFEYAPASRFEKARQRYEVKHRTAGGLGHPVANSDYCYDVYASQENTGLYGTYTDGITSTFCGNYNTVVGYAYPWSFTVTGDYSDKDNRIDPAVGIYDLNNNFNCYDAYAYGGDLGQCNATATTVWTNTACTNHVHAWGLLYYIEYTNDPYHDNYLGFELDIDNCTTFY